MKNTPLALILFLVTQLSLAKSLVPQVGIDTVLSDENVTYKFTQDDNYIFLNVSTSDEKAIMSMLHLGVSVFFDVKGKNKKNVFIKYPSEPIRPNFKGESKETKGQRRPKYKSSKEIEDEAHRKKRIKELLENDYPQKATYVYFDSEEEFHLQLNNLDISLSFTYDEVEGRLDYDLKIPKSKINNNTQKGLDNLAIGVKTMREKQKNEKEGISGNIGGLGIGGQQGGGQVRSGRGQGGGPSGGGRGQRGGQGSQRGGPPKSDTNKPTQTMLDFWFKPNSN